jgi:hypothetical protein
MNFRYRLQRGDRLKPIFNTQSFSAGMLSTCAAALYIDFNPLLCDNTTKIFGESIHKSIETNCAGIL